MKYKNNRKKIKILNVVGARPNYMKIAPILRACKKYKNIKMKLIHTGQHYDETLSDVFFRELSIPIPDYFLNVGSASHAKQTALIMIEFEKVVLKENPDIILVVGDVNSTLACSLVASKLGIKIAHIEAGLRSFDRTMPEEINRILTDQISDYLFTTSAEAKINLMKEGISKNKIFFTGNVMIDTLFYCKKIIGKGKNNIFLNDNLNKFIKHKDYALLTLHRPNSVDRRETLSKILSIMQKVSKDIKIVFPVHPRTDKMMKKYKIFNMTGKNILMTDPLGYFDFVKLLSNSKFVMTDSGGIQEETTALNIPCLTLRNNTERPITISKGSNELVGLSKKNILNAVKRILCGKKKKTQKIKYWDGKTAERIVKKLVTSL